MKPSPPSSQPTSTASSVSVSDHPSFSPSLSRSCRPEDLRTHPAPASPLLATLEPQCPLLLFSPSTTLTYWGYLLLITEPVSLTGHRTSRHHRGPFVNQICSELSLSLSISFTIFLFSQKK
ncbi:uncharacterized protein LOC127741065 [Arachis duranensis]|uniref:Uncharacterized protein LOC127741065 n=1 Tax=Arachis duranensis TaxID=130453 RepID=A0A9C6T228_ARADU|nr:uncharacterized protein LOC127741065 [Arachis duranensis]